MLIEFYLIFILTHSISANGYKCSESSREITDFWSRTLCMIRNTKSINFYGVFTYTQLHEFFESLINHVNDQCELAMNVEMYTTLKKFHIFTDAITMIGWPEIRKNGNQPYHRAVLMESIETIKKSSNSKAEKLIDMVHAVNVIVAEDEQSLHEIYQRKSSLGDWNPTQHFLIFLLWRNIFECDSSIQRIHNILRMLWTTRHIQNVFVTAPHVDNIKCKIFSYNPFKNEMEVENINNNTEKRIMNMLKTFADRRTRDFFGYTLRISLFETTATIKLKNMEKGSFYEYSCGYAGMDGYMLAMLSQQMNFSVTIIEPANNGAFGTQLGNGSYTGALGDLIYGRADVSFASFFIKNYGHNATPIEFSTYIEFDKICVIVPKAERIPKFLRIYHVFKPSIWMYSFLSLFTVIVVWYASQALSPLREKPIDSFRVIFDSFLVNSGAPLSKPPTTPASRVLLAVISLVTITLIGIFCGVLYKCFAQDMFYKEINNLRNVDASELPITISSMNLYDVFGTEADSSDTELTNRLRKKLKYSIGSMQHVALYRNTTALARQNNFGLISDHYSNIDEEDKLHLVPECPATFYLSYVFPKHSILKERFDTLLGRLNQGGLTPFIKHAIIEYMRSLNRVSKKHQLFYNQHLVPFKFLDLQTSFYTLAIGWVAATVVFLIEIKLPQKFLQYLKRIYHLIFN